jgi:hypothetical protein
MTARSAHHRDPRKCYRIILIAQRIYSKELEERKQKKGYTRTRRRRRSVSRIVIDFFYLLFSTIIKQEEMHPYTSNYSMPTSSLYHPSLSPFVHPLMPSVGASVMPPFPFFHGSPDRFTGTILITI